MGKIYIYWPKWAPLRRRMCYLWLHYATSSCFEVTNAHWVVFAKHIFSLQNKIWEVVASAVSKHQLLFFSIWKPRDADNIIDHEILNTSYFTYYELNYSLTFAWNLLSENNFLHGILVWKNCLRNIKSFVRWKSKGGNVLQCDVILKCFGSMKKAAAVCILKAPV